MVARVKAGERLSLKPNCSTGLDYETDKGGSSNPAGSATYFSLCNKESQSCLVGTSQESYYT